jgi:hypothetical protein
MRHSKEYRVPFLDMEFSLAALTADQIKKSVFRELAWIMGVPASIILANKYSGEEAYGRSQIKVQ